MADLVESLPNISSLLIAIRSMGYTFESAIEDLIDNSISAGASIVDVFSETQGCSPYIAIVDNGCGMSPKEAGEAMRMGTHLSRAYNPETLGRFGMGMKSASLSQCSCFTLVTKKDGVLSGFQFDVEQISLANNWVILQLSKEELVNVPEVAVFNEKEHGTLILWQNFDRLKAAEGGQLDAALRSAVRRTKKHAAFVFHRFYDKVQISFNSIQLERRDPFLEKSFPRSQKGRPVPLNGKVVAKPFVLPIAKSLTDEECGLLGITSSDKNELFAGQGFYIYRNDRLIHWGSWFRLERRLPAYRYARVCIELTRDDDMAWMLDVKKSMVRLPEISQANLEESIYNARCGSLEIVESETTSGKGLTQDCIWSYQNCDGNVSYKINRELPEIVQLRTILGEGDRALFNQLLAKIETSTPWRDQ